MYLHSLHIQHCKLMRDLKASFVKPDGTTRMWTVFVGENGTCKTTLLRTIALPAAGVAFANTLVRDPGSFLDHRGTEPAGMVFTNAHAAGSDVVSGLIVTTNGILGTSVSPEYVDEMDVRMREPALPLTATGEVTEKLFREILQIKLLDDARSNNLPGWFVAAYGTTRIIAAPLQRIENEPPQRQRLRSLFDPYFLPTGTGFSDTYDIEKAARFATILRQALVERIQAPNLQGIEFRGRNGNSDVDNAHSFEFDVGTGKLKLPAVWLSQGYQAVISLVADIIGHVWLDAGKEVPLDEMEGLVLVDELDLHLHPKWQTQIVQGLKRTFPKMQFIVTTHSPLVLAGCEADEVWTLKQDPETGDVTAEQGTVLPMLLTGSELNSVFFGVERASQLSEDARRYVEVASNRYRTDEEHAEALRLLEKLRSHGAKISFEPVKREPVEEP